MLGKQFVVKVEDLQEFLRAPPLGAFTHQYRTARKA
jgi:hypothetical protein